jgi:hypothetical protein
MPRESVTSIDAPFSPHSPVASTLAQALGEPRRLGVGVGEHHQELLPP